MIVSAVITLAGLAVCAWAFLTISQSPRRGSWGAKLTTLAVFASCLAWTLDRLTGDYWRWDGAFFLASLAVHLWIASPPCGLFRRIRDAAAQPPSA